MDVQGKNLVLFKFAHDVKYSLSYVQGPKKHIKSSYLYICGVLLLYYHCFELIVTFIFLSRSNMYAS